ncbi:MAG: lytic transglycosylase domain-containing protein [Bacteroidota bacterium]|jgi:membrane-bound lytic murein transglycosylase D
MKNAVYVIVGLFIVSILVYVYFYHVIPAQADEPELNLIKTDNHNLGKTYSVVLPDNLSFCSEPVPLNDQDVRERLDRELLINTYWQSQTLLIIKEFNKIKPIVEPILKEYGIPEDFIYLAAAESGYRNLVSPSKAAGIWQFLEETGKSYGLEINNEVDERYHFEKSTIAACKYIQKSYQKFGNWTMAAASYNMGLTGLDEVSFSQKQTNYYDLHLNTETSRYVFRILALKEILRSPSKYGFMISETDLYKPHAFKSISIDTAIASLTDFAALYKMTYKELKILNPWLRSNMLTNKSTKSYQLKIILDKQ